MEPFSDRRVWNSYGKAISAERRFVAYDQRNFGESRPDDENAVFSADTHADDLIGFVEKLNSGPVILVSWSYGGDVAARAAIDGEHLTSLLSNCSFVTVSGDNQYPLSVCHMHSS